MMGRRESEECYTPVGRPLPTDVGRMVRNVALVRVALLVGCGALLAIGLCVFGGLAWFAIAGTRPALAPRTPTPVPTVSPVSAVFPGGVGPGGGGTTWSTHILADAAPGPWWPEVSHARGEGRIKGWAHPPRFPRPC